MSRGMAKVFIVALFFPFGVMAQDAVALRPMSREEAATFELLLKQQERIGTYVPLGLAALSATVAAFLGYIAWRFGRDFKETLGDVRGDLKDQKAEFSKTLVEFKADVASEAQRALLGHDEKAKAALAAARLSISELAGLRQEVEVEKKGLDELVREVRGMRADVSAAVAKDYLGPFLKLRAADLSDQRMRESAFLALRYLIEGGKQNAVPADVLFNAAAIAGKMKLGAISHQLVAEASRIDPNAAHIKFRLLRSEVEQDPSKYHASLAELKRVLTMIRRENCELIYSEVANIAEHLRDYEGMVEAIEAQSGNGARTTSYADVVLANLVSRGGGDNWRARTVEYLKQACRKLETESPRSTWYDSTLEGIAELISPLGIEAAVFSDRISRKKFDELLSARMGGA